jgi:hypothetical protein
MDHAINRYLEFEIKTPQNVARDADKLKVLLKAKGREKIPCFKQKFL